MGMLGKIKARDPAGLEEAIAQYAEYVQAVVRKTMGAFWDPEDGEELTSDAFVALWKHGDRLREDSNLKFWLAVVARNGALRQLRKKKCEEPLEDNLLTTEEEAVFSEVESQERAQLVRQAVESLPSEDREIFLRHYFWRQSLGDIARETGKNLSTVKSRLKRGREKLREKLEQQGEGAIAL